MSEVLFKAEVLRANDLHANEIRSVLSDANQWLISKGMYHWDNFYTPERIAKYLAEREMFVLNLNGKTVGTVTLDSRDESPQWEPGIPSVYAYAFAVKPAYHRRGFGSFLLTFAEEVALQRGAKAVRFDALETFDWLKDFYLKRDYVVVGRVQRRFGYLLYEKKLMPQSGRPV